MRETLIGTLLKRLTLIGILLTALNIGFVGWYYGSDPEGLRREKVERQIDALAGALAQQPTGGLAVTLPPRLARLFSDHPTAYAFRVSTPDGRVIGEANSGLLPPVATTTADLSWSKSDVGGLDTLIGMRRVVAKGQEAYVTFAASSDPSQLTMLVFMDELLRHVVVPLIPFALLLTAVNILTVRRALEPLKAAAAAASSISASSGLRPIPSDGLPSEVQSLVAATNGALARLTDALEAERAFAAEAAHALRTPLAILANRARELPASPAMQALSADISAMTHLVNQLLSAAQAETLVIDPGASLDLPQAARDVVAAMAPLALARGRSLALDAVDEVSIAGDAAAVAHALRNVIDNALKFAPRGSEISISVAANGLLSVHDRGPGIADADKSRATERFWRTAGHPGGGTGLGLAIVQRIMTAHGGALMLKDREGGGATVEMLFRPANA